MTKNIIEMCALCGNPYCWMHYRSN